MKESPNIDLKAIRKEWNSANIIGKINLARYYAITLKHSSSADENYLIKLTNDALLAADYFKGSFPSDLIEYELDSLLKNVKNSEYFVEKVKFMIGSSKDIDLHNKVLDICERIKKRDGFSIELLISVVCSFESHKEIFMFFESFFSDIAKSLSLAKGEDEGGKIISLINSFIVSKDYVIDGKSYRSSTLDYFLRHRKIFNRLWDAFLMIYEFQTEVCQNLVKIIPKLWDLYIEERLIMLPTIINLFQKIQHTAKPEIFTIASRFIYKVFTDPEIPATIKSKIKIDLNDYIYSEHFCVSQPKSFSLATLKISEMFPLLLNIGPGEVRSVNFAVFPGSVFYLEFVLTSQSIHLNIRSDKRLYFSEANIPESLNYCKKIEFFDYDLIQVEWDNSFSWFNGKALRYRAAVLYLNDYEESENERVYAYLSRDKLVVYSGNTRDVHKAQSKLFEIIENYFDLNKRNTVYLLTSSQVKIKELGYKVFVLNETELLALHLSRERNLKNLIVYSANIDFRFSVILGGKLVKRDYESFCFSIGLLKEIVSLHREIFRGFQMFVCCFESCDLGELGFEVTFLNIDPESLIKEMPMLIE